jgi:hypothetical protein
MVARHGTRCGLKVPEVRIKGMNASFLEVRMTKNPFNVSELRSILVAKTPTDKYMSQPYADTAIEIAEEV